MKNIQTHMRQVMVHKFTHMHGRTRIFSVNVGIVHLEVTLVL